MKQIRLHGNKLVPALGQGTWYMGNDPGLRKQEADALRHGMDLGMTLIDTAEMYHDAELVVADALLGRRDQAFVVSKVLPSNASLKGTITACERSLGRLGIECIDLYLLHWAGSYPIDETLDAFLRLVDQGKIGSYGVSNLEVTDMEEAYASTGGTGIAANQLYYNLNHRGIEWDLLPWCRNRDIPVMAYSPLDQGRLGSMALDQIARRHGAINYQIALAWLLHQEDVIVIPKSSNKSHIDSNFAAMNIQLTAEDFIQIDQAYPPPERASPLEMT